MANGIAKQGQGVEAVYRIPLVLTPQPEAGYTVTSSALPELVAEGDGIAEALGNVQNARRAVIEIYHDEHKALPNSKWPVKEDRCSNPSR